ncbi:ty3-gypsy retrotransposon protein [Tanacetum coccineum]
MDKNTVCLWLKDHQVAAEKLGGGGDQGLLLPRLMHLDVQKFLGDDLDRWILSITKYFSLLNTPTDQRLQIVYFNLEGMAAEWFQWMLRNGLITTWDRLVESVKSRFGPSKYKDPQGALSKLLQLGTVEDYQREFEKLMNRVTDIPNSLLISFYILRFKLNLQHELLVSRPTMLGDTFSLARIIEAHFKSLNADEYIGVDEVSSVIDGLFDMGESNVEIMEVCSKIGKFSENKKSVEEVVGGGEALRVSEDDDSGNTTIDGGDDAVESKDISILNSLIGHGSPRSP